MHVCGCCARLATVIGSLAVARQLARLSNWAAAVDIPPIDPPDDLLAFTSSPSSPPSSAADGAHSESSVPPAPPFEEAFGPTDLISSPVPNEGDVQFLHALNAAIYEFIYSGTEEARRNRWQRIWRRYYKTSNLNADVALETLPPAHLCPPPSGSSSGFYPNRAEALGAFEENIFQQQNFIYIAEFSLPPFLFLSRKAPRGFVEVEDLDYTPNMAIMQASLVTPTSYVQRYLSTTCPLMMYGKLALLSGYGRKLGSTIDAWNSSRILVGTLAYVPWKEPVAKRLPKTRIYEYSSLIQLLAATRDGRIDGLLLPAETASVLLLKYGNIFGRYGISHFSIPQVVGHIGENHIPLVYTVRKYPMEPPYVKTFFDETYNPSKIICQEIL